MPHGYAGSNYQRRLWFIFFLCLIVIATPLGLPVVQANAATDLVKVCLRQNANEINFSLEGNYQLVNLDTGQTIDSNKTGQNWCVEKDGDSLIVYLDGHLIGAYQGTVLARQAGGQLNVVTADGVLWPTGQYSMLVTDSLSGAAFNMDLGQHDYYSINGAGQMELLTPGQQLNLISLNLGNQLKRYRGDLEIRPTATGFNIINVLPVEQYLYGVIPAEMPASFDMEALKAQTVAARSYLLNLIVKKPGSGFDVLDGQINQVYGGFNQEHPRTNQAVDATSGLVLTYAGQPVDALYHASSGGYTENSEDVYVNIVPYLKAKPDPADFNDKHYGWQVNYTNQQLVDLINKQSIKNQQGQVVQFTLITDMQIQDYTTSGQRVKNLLVTGLDSNDMIQQAIISGAERVRQVLGLKSSLFTIWPQFNDDLDLEQVTLIGNGWGHGVGLSQWGAQGLAQQGYNFQQILSYYYTDVDLTPNYGNLFK